MLSKPHNLIFTPRDSKKRHGIRVSLTGDDPFRHLLAEDWETFHWFITADERNAALSNMRRRHEYSRIGDVPAVQYEPVER